MVAMFFKSVAKRLEARGAPPSGVGRLADIGEGVGYIAMLLEKVVGGHLPYAAVVDRAHGYRPANRLAPFGDRFFA